MINKFEIAPEGVKVLRDVLDDKSHLTQRALDGGDVPLNIDDLMACGHEAKYIVYSTRRNYCGVCGQDAHPVNVPFSPTRRK